MFQVVSRDESFGDIITATMYSLQEIKNEWKNQLNYKRGLYDRMELRRDGEALEVAIWNKEEGEWDIRIA